MVKSSRYAVSIALPLLHRLPEMARLSSATPATHAGPSGQSDTLWTLQRRLDRLLSGDCDNEPHAAADHADWTGSSLHANGQPDDVSPKTATAHSICTLAYNQTGARTVFAFQTIKEGF